MAHSGPRRLAHICACGSIAFQTVLFGALTIQAFTIQPFALCSLAVCPFSVEPFTFQAISIRLLAIRLYTPRLRMLAHRRAKRIGAVVDEVLDKALPRWNLERTG